MRGNELVEFCFFFCPIRHHQWHLTTVKHFTCIRYFIWGFSAWHFLFDISFFFAFHLLLTTYNCSPFTIFFFCITLCRLFIHRRRDKASFFCNLFCDTIYRRVIWNLLFQSAHLSGSICLKEKRKEKAKHKTKRKWILNDAYPTQKKNAASRRLAFGYR